MLKKGVEKELLWLEREQWQRHLPCMWPTPGCDKSHEPCQRYPGVQVTVIFYVLGMEPCLAPYSESCHFSTWYLFAPVPESIPKHEGPCENLRLCSDQRSFFHPEPGNPIPTEARALSQALDALHTCSLL